MWNLPPHLGVGIPVALISSIGYGGHLLIFRKYLSNDEQLWFQFCLTMLWISYITAIYKNPGSPPKDYKPTSKQWRKWCRKCKAYKPERTHHCKQCRKCIKGMDHHCPWIANCVGHDNMPHFFRFLLWVDYTNGYAFVKLVKRGWAFWEDRNLPIYLISYTELVSVIVLTPLSLGVLVTVGLMTLRWLYTVIFKGMTQIESWEHERLESQLTSPRFLEKVKRNYKLFTGKELVSISSWAAANRKVRLDDEDDEFLNNETASSPFDSDDILFPYDLGPLNNLLNAWGYPWSWILPWGKPLGDGVTYKKDEYIDCDENDLSSIPWPPDGFHDDIVDSDVGTTSSKHDEGGLRQRSNISGNQWVNEFGETLSDFGVDLET